MRLLSIAIVRFINDEPQPGVVECELVDANGKVHRFVEKTAVVSSDHLFRDAAYPRPGVIACEVERSWVDENGQPLARVNTDPWGVESIDGVTTFVVFSSLIQDEA